MLCVADVKRSGGNWTCDIDPGPVGYYDGYLW